MTVSGRLKRKRATCSAGGERGGKGEGARPPEAGEERGGDGGHEARSDVERAKGGEGHCVLRRHRQGSLSGETGVECYASLQRKHTRCEDGGKL